jgi:hypothetical protein
MSAPDPKNMDTIRITNVTTHFLKEINFQRRGGKVLNPLVHLSTKLAGQKGKSLEQFVQNTEMK